MRTIQNILPSSCYKFYAINFLYSYCPIRNQIHHRKNTGRKKAVIVKLWTFVVLRYIHTAMATLLQAIIIDYFHHLKSLTTELVNFKRENLVQDQRFYWLFLKVCKYFLGFLINYRLLVLDCWEAKAVDSKYFHLIIILYLK